MPTLAAHFVTPCTYCHLATKCAALVGTVLGLQNVPCESTYFVTPHAMDLNIHSDIYLVNRKLSIIYLLYVYIIFIMYLQVQDNNNTCGFNNVVVKIFLSIYIG